MNCSCPCASQKIYVCAVEWQRLGLAALSAWLHWCFNIAGTFKIPLNTTHRHQRAWRKANEGQSRVGRAEEPAWSSCPAQVPSRARRDQVTQQTDSPPMPLQAHPFSSTLCESVLAGPNHPGQTSSILWTKPTQPRAVGALTTWHDFIRTGHIRILLGRAAQRSEAVLGWGHHRQ